VAQDAVRIFSDATGAVLDLYGDSQDFKSDTKQEQFDFDVTMNSDGKGAFIVTFYYCCVMKGHQHHMVFVKDKLSYHLDVVHAAFNVDFETLHKQNEAWKSAHKK
jgi:hypothetical protein